MCRKDACPERAVRFPYVEGCSILWCMVLSVSWSRAGLRVATRCPLFMIFEGRSFFYVPCFISRHRSVARRESIVFPANTAISSPPRYLRGWHRFRRMPSGFLQGSDTAKTEEAPCTKPAAKIEKASRKACFFLLEQKNSIFSFLPIA